MYDIDHTHIPKYIDKTLWFDMEGEGKYRGPIYIYIDLINYCKVEFLYKEYRGINTRWGGPGWPSRY